MGDTGNRANAEKPANHFGQASGGKTGYRQANDGYRTALGTRREGQYIWHPGDPPISRAPG